VAPSLQAELQHTPSVQKPLLHCGPAVQAAPLGLRPQELFTQVLGATHSLSWVQEEMHAEELHTKVPQDRSAGVAHVPCPSQAEAGVSEEVLEHTACLQASPLAKYAQAPPTHAPVVPQLDCKVAWHSSCGSGDRSATVAHRPSVEGRLQALQASVHARLQHTPWAQFPDWHSPPVLHSAPFGFFPHEPATQKFPATQSVSLVQPAEHAFPLQTYGLQVWEGGATHWPA
jgi:hypothetical protein